MSVYRTFHEVIAEAETRSDTWEKILRKATTVDELQEAIRQCNAIEGRAKCARLVRNAFVGLPIGFMLEDALPFLTHLRRITTTPEWLLQIVCREFHVRDVALLCSPSRQRTLVLARSAAAHFLHMEYSLTLVTIAHLLGRDNHSTILNALSVYERQSAASPEFKQRTEIIANHIAFAKSIP